MDAGQLGVTRIRVNGKTSRKSRHRKARTNRTSLLLILVVVIIVASAGGYAYFSLHSTSSSSTSTSSQTLNKPIILYVNQGNGLVTETSFSSLISTALSHGFNTIFFQIYRSGSLLFTQSELQYFISNAHAQNLRIFFALYFTNSSQVIPVSIYGMGEDGISLDMSSLPSNSQTILLATLEQNYHGGKTAVTTTNFATTLKPDLLILETYSASDKSFIHPGIIGGVEVLATSSKADYQAQLQYALSNSDGVMVFDYYGLTRTGY